MQARAMLALQLGTLTAMVVLAALVAARPVPVAAAGTTAISAGGDHTCALTSAGGVKCWGRNSDGQLGDGTRVSHNTPADVSGLTSGVAAVTAGGVHNGEGHTCALTVAGGVKCWGINVWGTLGIGMSPTPNRSTTPVDVIGLANGVGAIDAGLWYTCAVIMTGGVKCWGFGLNGQLGNGTTGIANAPVDVCATGASAPCTGSLLTDVTAVSTGAFTTCSLSSGGGVKCWGQGPLGNGSPFLTLSNTPVDVSGLTSGAAAVSVGSWHACALTTAGGVRCWGKNDVGQLGDGQACGSECNTPVPVSGLGSGVIAISAGLFHTCAITTSGGVKCWGGNDNGELGDGNSPIASDTPVDVTSLTSGVFSVRAGGSVEGPAHTCALTETSAVKCWGANTSGQLGDGNSPTGVATPVDVFDLGPKLPATPTPLPVGGIAELPDVARTPLATGGSSGPSIRVVAGVLAAAAASALALGGAAWYARRR